MKRFSPLERVGLVVAVFTLLSPIDLIPDITPIIGRLDDLLAALYLVIEVLKLLRTRRANT